MSNQADNDNDRDDQGIVLGDREVALDALVSASHAAQATHERAASIAKTGPEHDRLARLARERLAQHEALVEAMRAAGLTPKAPDPEREAVDAVVDRAAALIGDDERRAAAERAEEAEAELADALAEARRHEHEPDVAAVLERMAATDG